MRGCSKSRVESDDTIHNILMTKIQQNSTAGEPVEFRHDDVLSLVGWSSRGKVHHIRDVTAPRATNVHLNSTRTIRPNRSFVFARWQHRTDGLAAICNCMFWFVVLPPAASVSTKVSCTRTCMNLHVNLMQDANLCKFLAQVSWLCVTTITYIDDERNGRARPVMQPITTATQ